MSSSAQPAATHGEIDREAIGFLTKSDRLCPECGERFALMHYEGVQVDVCLPCGGIWFDAGELKAVTHQAADIPDEDSGDKRSRHKCPVCHSRMRQHLYKKPHRLLVDKCPDGHGVYLERGELLRALEIAENTEA